MVLKFIMVRYACFGIKKIVYLKLGGTVLELMHMPQGPCLSAHHCCLVSDAFEQDYQRLKAAEVLVEKGGRRVVFKGPDGEAIEFRGR